MTLRIALENLTDEHQRLLVEAAFHALNDLQFSAEVADLAGVDHESLAGENGFACQVVAPLFVAARSEDEAMQDSQRRQHPIPRDPTSVATNPEHVEALRSFIRLDPDKLGPNDVRDSSGRSPTA